MSGGSFFTSFIEGTKKIKRRNVIFSSKRLEPFFFLLGVVVVVTVVVCLNKPEPATPCKVYWRKRDAGGCWGPLFTSSKAKFHISASFRRGTRKMFITKQPRDANSKYLRRTRAI